MKKLLPAILLAAVIGLCAEAHAQQLVKKHVKFKDISFRDSLDGAFDMSDFLIEANGFIPLVTIISEPSLGGFGVGAAPVFMAKRTPMVREVKGKQVVLPVPPDITMGGGFYTANKSWGVIGGRMGTFDKGRMRYMGGGGYMSINMTFYRDIPALGGEQEFDFNIRSIPVYVSLMRRIGYSKWHGGMQYLFLNSKVEYTGPALPVPLPDDFTSGIDNNLTISQLGARIEFDGRDNTFTPDRGIKFHLDGSSSNSVFGSDFDFWRFNYYAYMYLPLRHNIIGGLRIDGQQAIGDAPFYMLPFVDMRGLPANRYQGKADLLTEGEVRWDVVERWSVMGFGGVGKAFDKWSEFGSAEWAYSFGTGFRYLIARQFKLRMGLDVAMGSDKNWGYYIVFGSNWLK